MHPSTVQAHVLVDELLRLGLREVVLSPGSRNTPLSLALFLASEQQKLRLHVRIDERSAGFLALGLAAERHEPVAVVCTSGTAAANLHPAVAEASYAGVPLLLLTADRPPGLRAAGANQTIDQYRLFGSAARAFMELEVAEKSLAAWERQNSYWRAELCRAWTVASGRAGEEFPGPVQVNVPFAEPLVDLSDPFAAAFQQHSLSASEQVGEESNPTSLAGRPDGGPWLRVDSSRAPTELTGITARRGLVVLAEHPDRAVRDHALAWAAEHRWPVVSETGELDSGDAVPAGLWLLKAPEFLERYKPDQVICVGRPTVFRQVNRLLSDRNVEVLLVHPAAAWPNPGHSVRAVAERLGTPRYASDVDWLESWWRAGQAAGKALHTALDRERWPTGMGVARDIVETISAESLLIVGSSNPTRDAALASRPRPDIQVHRNRGAAGIDGTVSTAIGAALAHPGPAYALLGDLTFLHDTNGLLIGPDEPRPDLTIVVLNDDGGGIFSLLEQGRLGESDASGARAFERVFGTPHGTDLASLCTAHGVEHRLIADSAQLAAELRPHSGLRVLEIPCVRREISAVHDRLTKAVMDAVIL